MEEDFGHDGFVVLRDVVPLDLLAACRSAALDVFETYLSTIAARSEALGVGQRGGYHEIVQRHLGRYEFRIDDATGPLRDLEAHIRRSRAFQAGVAKEVLDDPTVLSRTCVIASEGCEAQAWHVDGAHLDPTRHLPCHCLNVFVPLVDVSSGSGTELRPGSHHLTRDLKRLLLVAKARKTLRAPVTPRLALGDCLLFDYRTLHRGVANTSGAPRPVFVLTVARPFFRDVVNFPSRSLRVPPLDQQKG
ncbi:hypothetical protein CTAYLR_006414 [Chrysophaeum taylorii]|uniref:Phytanoyl-CoA dioxygenase n=1 Tax=Chrysophaeum taylorii TaxID=2483200 RepID=A0AAD7UBS6_9STRA|nr:hypothetical protein CTAYLR_006414 [Chrysophaeum taylorii]